MTGDSCGPEISLSMQRRNHQVQGRHSSEASRPATSKEPRRNGKGFKARWGPRRPRQTPKAQHKERCLFLSDHPQKRRSSDRSVPARAAETPPSPPGLFMSGFLPTTLLLLRVTEAMSYHGPAYNHPERPAVFFRMSSKVLSRPQVISSRAISN